MRVPLDKLPSRWLRVSLALVLLVPLSLVAALLEAAKALVEIIGGMPYQLGELWRGKRDG